MTDLPPAATDRLEKRSVVLAGHRTSVSLEGVFWQLLKGYAAADGLSLNALAGRIDAGRSGNLSSALRVYCVTRLLREGPPPSPADETTAGGALSAASAGCSAGP